MTEHQKQLITDFKKNLNKVNQQRILWLVLSTCLAIGFVLMTFSWETLVRIDSDLLWWIIGILGISSSLAWWIWTMIIIHKILQHQYTLLDILGEITTDIKIIKEEIIEVIKLD